VTTHSSTGPSTSNLADEAADSADAAIQSARQKAQDALDRLSDSVRDVKEEASATLGRFRPQFDSVTSYAKEEPTKALLIAAAVGAGIMGLVALIGRSGGGQHRVSLSETLRQAAGEAADSVRKAAQDAADRASAKADGAMKSARGAAQSAYEGLSDTVQQWKDQAAPLVDRIRPQIDTVMTYAKDDPVKALLIAAAAGAALVGLMSLAGSSRR
jgi:ElaB/YqjD/DUF883 family membrane-anchored ribosome-binding protein